MSKTTSLPFPLAYDAAQMATIEADRPSWVGDDFVEYRHDGLPATRRSVKGYEQHFAVFGNTAYQLFCERYEYEADSWHRVGGVWEWLPVLIDGALVGVFPDEGDSGVMHLARLTQNGKPHSRWITTALHKGWLYTRELSLTAAEIKANLVEEIGRGDNVLTKKPAGWA